MDSTNEKGQQTGSMSSLKILSFNPNSIGRNPKRSEILQFLRNKHPDIIFISDSRIGKEIESTVQAEWEGKSLFASFSSQARGVVYTSYKSEGEPGSPELLLEVYHSL